MTGWRDMADRVNQAVLRTFRESEPAYYIPAETGVQIGVVLFFESTFFEVNPETTVSRHVYNPHVFLRLADLGRLPADGDIIVIRGTRYIVQSEELDGYGGATLFLGKLD